MLSTSVERLEGNMVKLTVTVPAEQVDVEIAATYKKVAAQIKLPGFRPGKAPRPMIDNAVGQDYVLSEATEELVNKTYPKALDAESLRPIESPELEDIDTVKPGTEYTYVAEIEIRPELEVSGTDGLEIELPTAEATEAEIDMHIESARERFATLEPVEDRGAEADDFVLVSFVGTVDGEAYEGNEVDKYLYEMGRGLMPPEFDQGIVGANPGDDVRVEFVIPDTSSNPEFIGKTAAFDITVHEIKAKKLPEADDEFASNFGGFDSYQEMRDDLRTRIGVQKREAYDHAKERKSREVVAERLVGDVPQTMIDSRRATMMRDFMSMLETRGTDITQYLSATGMDMETVESDIATQAEQSVREDLALEALFRALGMEVTDEDVAEELDTIARATDADVDTARERWEAMGLMPVVMEQIMHRKALGWVLDNVTVNELAEDAAGGAEEPAAKAGTKKSGGKKKSKAAETADEAQTADAAADTADVDAEPEENEE